MEKESKNIIHIGYKLSESFVNLSMAFFIIITGILLLSQIPESLRFLYALSIMGSSVYFIMELYFIWGEK